MLAYGLSKNFKPNLLFEMSQRIINRTKQDDILISYPKTWLSLDVMKLGYLDKLGIGLKEVGIRLKFPLIQDLPFHWNEPIPLNSLDMVLKYNLNDVKITEKLYHYFQEELQLRIDTEEEYGFECASSARPTLAKDILRHLYLRPKGITYKDEQYLRTYRQSIKLSEVVSDKIHFLTEDFNNVLNELKSLTLHLFTDEKSGKKKYVAKNFEISYAGKIIDLKKGGIHTQDDSRIISADENWAIVDLDFSSFYPMIVLLLEFFPKHLSKDFLITYAKITNERLEAKEKGLKKAEILKIVINSIYGMFGSEYSFLYDPLCMFKTTYNGQLFLLMLIEKLIENGKENVKLVSLNTDGGTFLVRREYLSIFQSLYHEWEEEVRFKLEEVQYEKIIRKDVNNYIAISTKGKIKLKGDFVTEIQVGKGYDAPVIAKALYAYFVENKDYNSFILEHQDIYDFAIAQKVDKNKFNVYEEKLEDVEDWTFSKPLTKTNRYYACLPNEGFDNILIKARIVEDIKYEQVEKTSKKKDGTETKKLVWEWNNKPLRLLASSRTALLNDVKEETKIEDYKINYFYYTERARKIIQEIEGTWDKKKEAQIKSSKTREAKKLKKIRDYEKVQIPLWG